MSSAVSRVQSDTLYVVGATVSAVVVAVVGVVVDVVGEIVIKAVDGIVTVEVGAEVEEFDDPLGGCWIIPVIKAIPPTAATTTTAITIKTAVFIT